MTYFGGLTDLGVEAYRAIRHPTMTYDQYLLTDHWKRMRRETSRHYGQRCAMCRTRYRLNVHHVRYVRDGKSIWFCEREEDLILVCRDCHKVIHAGLLLDPSRAIAFTEDMIGGRHLNIQSHIESTFARAEVPKFQPSPYLVSHNRHPSMPKAVRRRKAREFRQALKQKQQQHKYDPLLGTWSR